MATKQRRLTIKQQKFVKEYVKTGNGSQAVMQVYDTKDSEVAKVIASENLTKPNVKQAIDNALDKAGLTINRIGYHLHRWAESDVHDASLRAISLAGDFRGLKVHKLEGHIDHVHTIVDKKISDMFVREEVIDVEGDAT